jgi:hypothetical protein
MAKNGYGGVSSQTKRGLIESGAMDKSDFGMSDSKPQKSIIPKDPTRQVTQSQYNAQLKKQKAESEPKYQAYKQGKYDYGKNLGKYLHKSRKP